MSNFVWDETSLPADKVDAINVPTGANTVNYIRGSDITAIFNALREIRLAAYKGGGVTTPAATAPVDGTHEPGDIAFNSNPTEAGFLGWVCLTAGTPGQWRKFGLIADAAGNFPASAIANTPSGNLAATNQQAVNNELQADVDGRALVGHNHDATYSPIAHNHDGTYQPVDGDLTSIAGLAGTSGLLKKDAANTWSLDTSTYATSTALNDHLNDTTDAHDASAISVAAITGLSASDVQAALAEHQSDIDGLSGGTALSDHLNDIDDAHDASAISFTPNGTIAATNVQAAIQEVRDEAAGGFPDTTGTVAPASGTWAVGDICLNSAPAAGEPVGWVCITAGTPGTWRAFGTVMDHGTAVNAINFTTTYDPPSLSSSTGTTTTFTVTGAAVGDQVLVSFSNNTAAGNYWFFGFVESANTVRVQVFNATAGTVNLSSGTLAILVLKYR